MNPLTDTRALCVGREGRGGDLLGDGEPGPVLRRPGRAGPVRHHHKGAHRPGACSPKGNSHNNILLAPTLSLSLVFQRVTCVMWCPGKRPGALDSECTTLAVACVAGLAFQRVTRLAGISTTLHTGQPCKWRSPSALLIADSPLLARCKRLPHVRKGAPRAYARLANQTASYLNSLVVTHCSSESAGMIWYCT